MMNSELMRIEEVLDAMAFPKASVVQGGDICIPSEQSISRKIRFPWSWFSGKKDEELFVTSTADFAAAIDAAESILEKKIADPTNAKAHLDCFREVIAYANKPQVSNVLEPMKQEHTHAANRTERAPSSCLKRWLREKEKSKTTDYTECTEGNQFTSTSSAIIRVF